VFAEPLSSNGLILWLHYSEFQALIGIHRQQGDLIRFFLFYQNRKVQSDLHWISGNVPTNGHTKSDYNTTIQIFRGLNKIPQQTWTPQKDKSAETDKELCSQKNVF
jgi:hypothetical protein